MFLPERQDLKKEMVFNSLMHLKPKLHHDTHQVHNICDKTLHLDTLCIVSIRFLNILYDMFIYL